MSPLEIIAGYGVLPVIVLDDAARARALGDALIDGGLPLAEVTFRTPDAAEAIRIMAANPDLLVGAGTVTSAAHVDLALAAGADFIVSPGVSRAVIRRCADVGLPVIPGVATASDIMVALDEGVRVLKFFPAETNGGLRALTALAAPFLEVGFVPTGGIGPDNALAYLRHPNVVAVGGTWMVPAASPGAGALDDVVRLSREAVALAAKRVSA